MSSQSDPRPTILEDNPTEGEKKGGQEKEVQVQVRSDKGKGKEVATDSQQAEDLFVDDMAGNDEAELEEGEIPNTGEAYEPMYVESIHGWRVVEDEFVEEDAYDTDCMGAKINVASNFDEAMKKQKEFEERKVSRL